MLKKAGIEFVLHVEDVQQHFEESMDSFDSTRWGRGEEDSFFDSYHTYDQIVQWATNMTNTFDGSNDGDLSFKMVSSSHSLPKALSLSSPLTPDCLSFLLSPHHIHYIPMPSYTAVDLNLIMEF